MKKNSTENVLRVLGLESSCDDTAASVLKIVDNNKEKKVKILSSIVFNQNKLHVNFNGVVPEIAARAHCEKIDICTKEALKKVENKVKRAKAEGARLLTGGSRPKEFENGYFYSPTVFDKIDSNMEMMNIETFGPVIPIQKVKNLTEAINLANNSDYGLGCNIYTNDMEKALTAAEDIKAGSFWINDPLTDNEAAPFGGMKMSGGGRELGIEGLDEFREPKHILIDYQIRDKDYWFPYDLEEGRKT